MHRNLFVFLLLNVFYVRIDSTAIRCESSDLFQCENQNCISTGYECDGENDCGDYSDEKNCENFNFTLSMIQCATDEFQCKDYGCIPVEKFCDTVSDCSDGSDEYKDCVIDLKCNNFRCSDGHCVRNEWVCDGVSDCPDSSDETKCDNKTIPVSECNNEINRYLCKNQRCIFLNGTCNEKDDCGDNSDEGIDECKKADSVCRTANCEHYCRKTPQGAQCSCRSGYRLLNNRTCTDVNECENYGSCDQRCINTAGSYTCACQFGYSLSDDKRTCKAEGGEALLVFSIKSEIRGLYLDSKVYYSVTRNLQHAVGVSVDANYVYWSDIEDGDEAIIRSLEDGSQREVIVTTGLSSPDDIAVDWVTGNIYFTDSGLMHIGVCANDGSYCTVIVKERNDKPRSLVLMPSSGIMYWAEWGLDSRILMSGMDGKNSSAFVTENIEWPNGLTIDYANNRMYWIDAKLKIIESIRLDGLDRRTILRGIVKKPFSLAVFENKLYWSDWASYTIQSCDKFTGKNWKILKEANSTIYGLHIYHSVLKPKMPNPCNTNPCSQLCLLNVEKNYTCACTLDKELASDRHTCRVVKKKQHLVIAGGNMFIDYYHELLGKPKMTPSVTLKHVTEVTYNPLIGAVLASDQLTDNIFYFNTTNGEMKTIMSIEEEILGGMDFDYIANNLYLSNLRDKTIEVHSLNTNEKTVFYFQDEPHAIALVPTDGVMFVVFHIHGKYRIDLMKMNGIGPRIPIEGTRSRLFGPKVSLCYDRDLKRLFWSDQGTGRIGSTTINGFQTYIFRTGLSEPVSLAVLGDHIFWTQYNSKQLYWASKTSTQQYQKRITLHVPTELDTLNLVALHGSYVNEKHECRIINGNCSHVCLLSNLRSHICACPPDMMLNVDNRTCSLQTACDPGEIKCGEHDMCIKLHQRCDGVRDCPSGEDESSVCEELNSCENDQFLCKSGECISRTKHCNSHYDCMDRSDEEDCDKKECNSNEFQCHEGTCISKYHVCNGQYDCSDFSDEINCAKHKCDVDSFMCETGACIPKTWKCDGEVDCSDSSDENEICQRNTCTSDMFTCSNNHCIDSSLECNGIDDCEDNSDERFCLERRKSHFTNCTDNQYRCYGTDMCLPKGVRCNGLWDCPKYDDERNCVRCQAEEFACDNRNCIDGRWVCDMVDDCGDGSDERDCDGGNSRKTSVSSASNCKEFRCSNGVCLPFDKVCDGKPDCLDRSDEFGECSISCVKNNPCENICHKTPTGPVCGCQTGYQLSPDSKTCEDVNECEQNACSQICQNTVGSFTCSCSNGYILRNDKTSCKVAGPQMELITTVGGDIRKLSPSLSTIEIVYNEIIYDIRGIDVNAIEGSVYWSNDDLGMISKINIKSQERVTVVGVGRPEALAVDWITDNVYFIDNDHPSSIKVCNLEQQKCTNLVSVEARIAAMAIAVDPTQGLLFWSQTSWQLYDKPSSEIYRSDTSGSNATAIVYRNIGVIYALTIDHTRSRLYWADTFLKTIESSNLDGSNSAIFLKTDEYQPLSMNIYESTLYWLMGTTGKIQKCKLHDDKSCTTFSIGSSNVDKHFTILHTSRQPSVKNACEDHKCDYLCVLGKNNSVCICHNGQPQDSKGTCKPNVNTKIKFDSSIVQRKHNTVRQQNGAMIGIIIATVVCIIALSGYIYYVKVNSSFPKKNRLSIHFLNPSYERRNSVIATSFNHVAGLSPGEQEYVNPVTNMSKGHGEKVLENNEKQIMIDVHSDRSDDESNNVQTVYKQNIRLIQ